MTFLLVTTIKDEGPNILEWVAHHRVIGFDRIMVFQNDSTDLTLKHLRTLARIGAIEFYNNKAKPGHWQNRAYRRASRTDSYAKATWCMALDGDEFLNVHVAGGKVQDLADACQDADEILINWRNFGCSGHLRLDDRLVTDRFRLTDPAEWIRTWPIGYKTLFRATSFTRPGIHRPRVPKKDNISSCNGSGIPTTEHAPKSWRSTDPGVRALAQVNHYPVRDLESFMIKIARGSSSHHDRDVGINYWKAYARYQATDVSIARYSTDLANEMKRLDDRSRGRLRMLRDESIKIWHKKFEDLMASNDLRRLHDEILELIPEDIRQGGI